MNGLANGLFLLLFLVAPAMSWQYGFERIWWAVLLGMLVLVGGIAVAYFRAHRRLNPGRTAGAAPWIMLLNPLAAIRATDVLSRDLFARFHPLTAASVLCRPEDMRDLAGLVLRDALHPLQPLLHENESDALATALWFHERELTAIQRFFAAAEIDTAELLAPEEQIDPTCRSYCPRCLGQFRLTAGRCESCGADLIALPQRNGG